MSVVINDKPRQRTLNWRWPFSRQITLSLGTLAVILAVWWTVAALQLISPLFLPPPGQVLQKLLVIAGPQGFMDATLWQHWAASLARIVIALLAAVLLGVPVGIAMGLSPTMRGILDPIIELYRPVPPLAYLPLMVIWFGIGETSKILLIYLAIFAPVAMSALAGVRSAQQVRVRAAQSLGASRAQVLWFVILPGALPEILTGLRIGLAVVKGLALPRQIPCAGVSTMAALAYGLAGEGTVIGAQDARRGQVYWGAFDLAAHDRLTPDAAAPVTTLENFVQTCKKPLFFVGDGATLCYNTYKNVPGVVCVPQPMQVLRGAGVALAARAMWERGECVPPAALLPDYHRLSQAERERAEREKTEGKQNEV